MYVFFNRYWFDTTREEIGYKKDHQEISIVDTSWRLNMKELLMLALQALSWASKMQTCNTHYNMESVFIVLIGTCKDQRGKMTVSGMKL